jgi:hypothetical protein
MVLKSAADAFDAARMRRFVLPGVVLAFGVHPYVVSWVGEPLVLTFNLTGLVLFLVETIFLGLLITSAATPIFYVYEGFRFKWLTHLARRRNEAKVKRLIKEQASIYGDKTRDELTSNQQERVDVIHEYLSDFPVLETDQGTTYVVERSTRLGNLIAAYELYPESRYGLDGTFFWFHLLYLAPEAARKEAQGNILYAETMVLTSAAGVMVILSGFSAVAGNAVDLLAQHVKLPVSTFFGLVQIAFGSVVYLSFYALALPAYREAGMAFRALTDLAMPKLQGWISMAPIPPKADFKARAEQVTEYLKVLAMDSVDANDD